MAKYPAIARLWREQWERIIPFFAFPDELGKVVYTTNAVESLHMSLREIIKIRGSDPGGRRAAVRKTAQSPTSRMSAHPPTPPVGSGVNARMVLARKGSLRRGNRRALARVRHSG